MTDEHFKKLQTLILDQGVKIEKLAMTVRSLERRIEELTVEPINAADPVTLYESEELEELIRTRQSRAPRSDSE